MNERIRELAEQATRKYDRLGNDIPFAQPDLELFAELIVRECINVVENNENYSAGITDIVDEYKTGVQVGLASAVCDIERYFDIEN